MNLRKLSTDTTRTLYDAVLFIVAFALYAPSLQNGFVGDDLIYFIGNRHLKEFDVSTILRHGAIGADYLPLRDLSFALDYWLWGENPLGFHLTNVVLFAVTVVAARHLFTMLNNFLLGRQHPSSAPLSFLAALIAAFHPNHREVVYAIYNRGALLTVLFSIVAIALFIRFLNGEKNRYRFYGGALVCFIFALMSREYCISLPLVLALLVSFDMRPGRMRHFVYVIPFFLVACGFFFVFRQYAIEANFITSSAPLMSESLSKASLAAKIMLFYLVRMVTSLGEFNFDGFSALTVVAVSVMAGLLVVSALRKQKSPQLLFGLLFYLACLIPALNFYKTLPIVSPRYSFLPCMGIFFTVTAAPYAGRIKLTPVLLAGATFVWTMMTMHKTYYWKDNISYWELFAARDKTAYAFKQLGFAYAEAKQYAKACDAFSLVEPPPAEASFFAAFGKSCFELGDYRCAIWAFENAAALDTANDDVSLALARSYEAAGDQVQAQNEYETVRSRFPSLTDGQP